MPTILFSRRFLSLATAALLLSAAGGCGLIGRSAPVVDRSQDTRIEREVRDRLLREPALAADSLRVEVDGGVVRLYGTVRGMGAWRCALHAAELVPGVRSVVDYLLLARGPRDASCLDPVPATPLATDP